MLVGIEVGDIGRTDDARAVAMEASTSRAAPIRSNYDVEIGGKQVTETSHED